MDRQSASWQKGKCTSHESPVSTTSRIPEAAGGRHRYPRNRSATWTMRSIACLCKTPADGSSSNARAHSSNLQETQNMRCVATQAHALSGTASLIIDCS